MGRIDNGRPTLDEVSERPAAGGRGHEIGWSRRSSDEADATFASVRRSACTSLRPRASLEGGFAPGPNPEPRWEEPIRRAVSTPSHDISTTTTAHVSDYGVNEGLVVEM